MIEKLKAEGIHLSLSPAGKLEATGDKKTVERFLPMLRERKAELIAALKKPEWCSGPGCSDYEEINLPRQGMTPGCVTKEPDCETWRRLDMMKACPFAWKKEIEC